MLPQTLRKATSVPFVSLNQAIPNSRWCAPPTAIHRVRNPPWFVGMTPLMAARIIIAQPNHKLSAGPFSGGFIERLVGVNVDEFVCAGSCESKTSG